MKTDAELLGLYLDNGSEAAFTELVARHADMVCATAQRVLRNHEHSRDAAQNAFIALAAKAPLLRGRADLAVWLHWTAVNKAKERVREEVRRMKREEEAVLNQEAPADAGHDMEEVLDAALLDLREKDRRVLILRFFEKLSLREVGQVVGLSDDSAQKRVAAALQKLAAALRRKSGAAVGTAAAARALEAACQTAPAGFAALAARAALQQGMAPLSGLGWLLAKALALSKTQTAFLSAAVAAAPLLVQQARTSAAEREHQRLASALAARQDEMGAAAAELARVQASLRSVRSLLGPLEEAVRRRQEPRPAALVADADPRLYRWNEESEYVRVPKTLLRRVTLAEEAALPFERDARSEKPRHVMTDDGTWSELVMAGLGIPEARQPEVQQLSQEFARRFYALTEPHSILTNTPPGMHGYGGESKTLTIQPFSEGAALEEEFHAALSRLIGPERADVFFNQAAQDFLTHFGGFGRFKRTLTVAKTGIWPREFFVMEKVNPRDAQGVYNSGDYTWEELPEKLKQWWPGHVPIENGDEQ